MQSPRMVRRDRAGWPGFTFRPYFPNHPGGRTMPRIAITPAISLDEAEIAFTFLRAGGPGGQNVNKVETAVQLRFDVRDSPSLDERVKERLTRLAGSRMTNEGVL